MTIFMLALARDPEAFYAKRVEDFQTLSGLLKEKIQ